MNQLLIKDNIDIYSYLHFSCSQSLVWLDARLHKVCISMENLPHTWQRSSKRLWKHRCCTFCAAIYYSRHTEGLLVSVAFIRKIAKRTRISTFDWNQSQTDAKKWRCSSSFNLRLKALISEVTVEQQILTLVCYVSVALIRKIAKRTRISTFDWGH